MYTIGPRLFLGGCILSYLSMCPSGLTAAATYTTVDVPNASATFVTGINNNGDVTGGFYYAPNVYQGFLRTADGTITIFNLVNSDPNGATETNPTAINNSDVITGNIFGSQGCSASPQCNRGFVRNADGTFAVFDVLANTFPYGINTSGEAAGASYDANYIASSGFIRSSGGTIATLGGVVYGINDNGDTTGLEIQLGQLLGFVQTAAGTVTTFSVKDRWSTYALGINDSQQIAGSAENILCQSKFCDITESVGFLRQPSGGITTFTVPGNHQTFALGINASGQIFGVYREGVNEQHGFARDSAGTITPFDVPKSTGTLPASMNDSGVIVGQFFDTEGVLHGFIRTP